MMEQNYSIDDLLDIVEGRKRFPASEAAAVPIRKIPTTEITADTINVKPVEIPQTENPPVTPTGNFARDAYNKVLNPNIYDKMRYEEVAKDEIKGADDSEALMKKMLRNQIQMANTEPTKFEAEDIDLAGLMERYGNEEKESSKAYSPDMVSQLIYALGPAALGMAFGGNEGASAAVSAQGVGNKMMEKEFEAASKKQAMQKLSSGSKLRGIADIIKAKNDIAEKKSKSEYDVEKLKFDKYKDAVSTAMTMYDKKLVSRNKFLDLMNDAQKQINTFSGKGIDKTIEGEEKALDRASMEKRAKEMAKAGMMRQQNPTEGERKAASLYGTYRQAMDQYKSFIKESGGKLPSEKSKAYDYYKNLLLSADGNSAAGVILKSLQDIPADVQRQLSLELAIVDPIMRERTGAAATVSEFAMFHNNYFSRRGTSEKDKAARMARLEQEGENLKGHAGRAPLPQQVKVDFKEEKPPPKPTVKQIGGKTYIFKDGKWKPQN